jgi:ankyrin repeat protein
MLSCLCLQLQVTRVLLSLLGAPPSLPDNAGATPLHLAAEAREPDARLVTLLLAHGANPLAVDQGGWTPLHLGGYKAHQRTGPTSYTDTCCSIASKGPQHG